MRLEKKNFNKESVSDLSFIWKANIYAKSFVSVLLWSWGCKEHDYWIYGLSCRLPLRTAGKQSTQSKRRSHRYGNIMMMMKMMAKHNAYFHKMVLQLMCHFDLRKWIKYCRYFWKPFVHLRYNCLLDDYFQETLS